MDRIDEMKQSTLAFLHCTNLWSVLKRINHWGMVATKKLSREFHGEMYRKCFLKLLETLLRLKSMLIKEYS